MDTPAKDELRELALKIEALGFVGSDDLTDYEVKKVIAALRFRASSRSEEVREAGEYIKSAYDELCVKFSGVHSDDEMDSVLLRLHAALKKLGVDPLTASPTEAPTEGNAT